MPPTTDVRPPRIPGAVLRSGYHVATIDDVDHYLRGLQRWLFAELEARPETGMRSIERYLVDRDRLLDARGRLMGLSG